MKSNYTLLRSLRHRRAALLVLILSGLMTSMLLPAQIHSRQWKHTLRTSRAIVWHDGRGDKSKKLVITNSHFDAASPTVLGRYHHDSQFFFVSCTMSKNILDTNISYAYTDKVLDPCPWGQRVYFHNCTREGGHGLWMNDNLSQAEGSPQYHTVTAQWTFNGQWDPEEVVRKLWRYICY